MKVIMTCGGTGGHIYPAVAIADEIRRRYDDAEVKFIGSQIGMEKDLVPDYGYEIVLINADGMSRSVKGMVRSLQRNMKGRRQAKKLIADFRPDLVIGTGGYASAPVVSMAEKAGVPTYIHEQNAIPGKTNKFLGRKARKIFLGFAKAGEYFSDPQKHILTGNPVRREFLETSRDAAREKLGIGENVFSLLAFGGSQGAGRLNREMLQVIRRYNGQPDVRVVLGAGSYYYEAILAQLAEEGIDLSDNIVIYEYIHDMATELAACDLIVSRSGALTVAEVTVSGVPAIFIPFPQAAENHQFYNAQAVAESGGALVIEEADLGEHVLAQTIETLQRDPARLQEMARRSAACGTRRAAEDICDCIFEDLGK